MVEYCKKRYGVNSVANIVTKSYQKPKGAIRNTARVMGVEKGKRDEYLTIADKIAMLYQGKIIWYGTVKELDKTTNPYVRQFINGSSKGPIKVEK